MTREYAALMIDLKDSRSFPDEERNIIQRFWFDITKVLNKMFADTMEFEVSFSGGDQIQGLFKSPDAAFLYYRLVSMCTHPQQTHGGIGIGTCNIRLKDEKTGAQDGKAYHLARAASDRADADIGYPILLNSGSVDRDRIVNTIIGTVALTALKHSTYQNQIMLLTELLYPISDEFVRISYEIMSDEVFELVRLKHEFDQHFGNQQKKVLPLDRLMKLGRNSFEIALTRRKMKPKTRSNYITEGKVQGIYAELSDILGITRQSIATTLKNADIFNIRNLSIAALEEMQRI